MKNKLTDLNNHLFCQIERLNNEELKGGDLIDEIKRSQAMATIAERVISNGRLLLDSHKAKDDMVEIKLPEILTG